MPAFGLISGISDLFGGGGGGAARVTSATATTSGRDCAGRCCETVRGRRDYDAARRTPLRRYAFGGIANTPQLALFGEGRQNEAYVPLPDGRAIPVNVRDRTSGTTVQKGPSALAAQQWQRAPAVTLQIHPDAMHMTLRDWFEGELARQMAQR